MPCLNRSLLVLLSFLGLCAGDIGASESARPFVQDRFAIGLWVPPVAGPKLDERYRELAEAHFNLVIGTSGTNVNEQLTLCERFGLKAIVGRSEAPAPWLDHSACWGALLTDEPAESVFPALAMQAAEIRDKHPGRLGYINLFPNYATPQQLGSPTYESHVAAFMKDVKPEILSMDHYPLMRQDADGRAAYCENLETLRRHSQAAKIPFWNYFQAMPFGDHPDPTEAQIRWQIFTSIAYGAKGVLYFCYWTPGQGNGGTGEFPKGGAIITAEGRRTRHYDEARRINGELLHLGPTLMTLSSDEVRRFKTGPTSTHFPPGFPLRSVTRTGNDVESELLVGTFHMADGRRAVVIVNDSLAYTAWPTLEFDVLAAEVQEVDKSTGGLAKAIDDSPETRGFQLSLGAGDGRLFILPAAR